MTRKQMIRFSQVFALVAIVAALATPALALGGTSPGTPEADWFARAVAAHAAAQKAVSPARALDALERYAAAHPYGNGVGASNTSARPRLVVAKPITRLFVDDWFRDQNASAARTHHAVARPVTQLFVDDWWRDSK